MSQSSLGERTLWTLGSYEGLLQSCIATIKNRGHRALAEELSQVAALRFLEVFPFRAEVDAVMAVPASRQGQRFRGFSLPQMMEDALRAQSGWPTLPPDIRRCYRSAAKSSKGMGGAERLARMHGDRLEAPALNHDVRTEPRRAPSDPFGFHDPLVCSLRSSS